MQYVAIDAGGTWIKAARYDDQLVAHDAMKVPSRAAEGKEAYGQSIREVLARYAAPETVIGLALPGVLTPDRERLRYLPNVPGLHVGSGGIAVAELLGDTQHLPLIAENDANCAALGEWAQGVPRGDLTARLLHLTWGTGIGTGVVAEGDLQPGWEGGHMPIHHQETAAINCACGSWHDVEAYAAVPHMVTVAERGMHLGKIATALTEADFDQPAAVPRRLVDLAEDNDPLCQAVIDTALRALAEGLKAMAVISYPTHITIGGGFMDRDWLLERLREHIGQDDSSVVNDAIHPDIVQRAHVGNAAGLLGAAILAQQRFG